MGKTLAICRRAVLLPGEMLPERFRAPGRHHVSCCCGMACLDPFECCSLWLQGFDARPKQSRLACHKHLAAGAGKLDLPWALLAQGVVPR